MGIFDSIFQAKPKTNEGTKYTLVVFDWDSFNHVQDLHFLAQYENPVLWFVTRGKWDPRWDVLKSKYSVTHLQVPAYERSLISFLICALMFEVAANRVYKKIVIAAGHPYFKGTVSFLLEKKILAELYQVDGRTQSEDRNNRRNERYDRSERSDRNNRNERTDRPERNERISRTERPERVERNERNERNERPERHSSNERIERTERPERNDNIHSALNEQREFREQREQREPRDRNPLPVNRRNEETQPRNRRTPLPEQQEGNDIPPQEHSANESNRLPTNSDLHQIVDFFNRNYLVGQVYQKSFFGMLIKQATGRTAPEVLGTKNAKPFIQVLMRNNCIEQVDSQTFKVLKSVDMEMFAESQQRQHRRRNPNRFRNRRPEAIEE